MWRTVCRDCGWTTTQYEIDSAFASGQAHAQECPGHTIMIDPLETAPPENSTRSLKERLAPLHVQSK